MIKVQIDADQIVKMLTQGNELPKNIRVKAGLPPNCSLDVVKFNYTTNQLVMWFHDPAQKGNLVIDRDIHLESF